VTEIRTIKVSWKASRTRTVDGYKLYWSQDGTLDYSSRSVHIGNVTRIVLPDALGTDQFHQGPLRFGLTAVDQNENESDMRIIGSFHLYKAPAESSEPKAPETDGPQHGLLADPARRLVFMQLNASEHEAQCYEQRRGLIPLTKSSRHLNRDAVSKTKSVLIELNRHLDRLLHQA
jgi:hypothetical protein